MKNFDQCLGNIHVEELNYFDCLYGTRQIQAYTRFYCIWYKRPPDRAKVAKVVLQFRQKIMNFKIFEGELCSLKFLRCFQSLKEVNTSVSGCSRNHNLSQTVTKDTKGTHSRQSICGKSWTKLKGVQGKSLNTDWNTIWTFGNGTVEMSNHFINHHPVIWREVTVLRKVKVVESDLHLQK